MKKTYKILLSFLLILMSGMVFSQSVPSYVPTNGLVGWWGFNGNAQDGSGNGNHGTVNNGLSYTADRLSANNAAIQVIMDWSLCSSPTGFGVTFPVNLVNENYAVSVWVRSYDSIAHNQSIFNSSPHALIGLGLNYGVNNPRNTISSFFGNGSWLLTNNNITWNTSALQDWKHLVVVKFLNELKYYENGSLVFSHFIMPYGQPLTLDSIRFGSSTVNAGCYEPFYGKLDDIGIWNRALSQQEITNLYNSQLPAQTSLCLPTITTSSPTSVGVDTVVIGGDISNDGGSSIALRGICYSTSPNPNMGNQRTEDGSGTGSFNTVLRGLASSTTYYARSYAKNSNGVVVYGNEVSFTTSASLPGVRCPGTPTVTDIDGNIYNTVQIGNQCWTQSNLKVSKYRNGDTIPNFIGNTAWSQTNTSWTGAWCNFDNISANDALYGKLYNWYAVEDLRGICPSGWHVPSDAEWTTLENHLGGPSVAGGALTSTLTLPNTGGWASPNTSATNLSGFTALPGGLRSLGGIFDYVISNGAWWSTTEQSMSNVWRRNLQESYIWRYSDDKSSGFSVRCLKNTLPQVNTTSVTNVTPSTALVTGEVISEGDQNTTRGFCYSTTSNPTLSNDTTMNGTGLGVYTGTLMNLSPLTSYYVRAYATNSVGTSYGSELSFTTSSIPSFTCGTSTVSDVDNNTYNTVQIGTQCWTQSNLKTSRYRNGDSIPTGLSNSDWQNTTSGAYAIYSNDPVNDGLYGKLYNHYAVTDSRGLCPTGWHVPSDGEWTTLVNHLGGSSVAGGSLKSTAMQPTPGGWNPPNTGATNSSGFTALPGGLRDLLGGFDNLTYIGGWWSSSVFSGSVAWNRFLTNTPSNFYRDDYNRHNGFSVRCLKD